MTIIKKFFVQVGRFFQQFDETKQRLLDSGIKIVTLILATAGFAIGLETYISNQQAIRIQIAKDNEMVELSFKQPFWELQLKTYMEACDMASAMANGDPARRERYDFAKQRFKELYFGMLAIVESSEVALEMQSFYAAIPDDPPEIGTEESFSLSIAALKLSKKCRDAALRDWRIPLKELPDLKIK